MLSLFATKLLFKEIINFIVTPYTNNIQHFNFQLMHTTLKKLESLKHFKIKTAPTCFGLQRNRHQGAPVSISLKLHSWFKMDTWSSYKTSVLWLRIVTCEVCTVHTVHGTHTSQVTIRSHNTEVLYELHVSILNQVCNFS